MSSFGISTFPAINLSEVQAIRETALKATEEAEEAGDDEPKEEVEVEEIPSLQHLLGKAVKEFRITYGENPTVAAAAPGRINLLGDHTDYNNGYVLPMALPLVTVVVGGPTNRPTCRIKTGSSQEQLEFTLQDLTVSKLAWVNYVKGVVSEFHGKSSLPSFDMVVESSVPQGGGISSSASLCVAMYTFLEELTGSSAPSLKEKALACQAAQHRLGGTQCGIMDQLISVMAKDGTALLIDCRDLQTRQVNLCDPNLAVVITNSHVQHENIHTYEANHQLTGSEFPERRRICEEAARTFGTASLREVTLDELEEAKNNFTLEQYNRVKHVLTEIQRTVDAVDCFEKGDYQAVGKLMVQSHKSLRDHYEVSCAELDLLVESAMEVEGVYGSRMTGGGFGGCTVTLLKQECISGFVRHVAQKYGQCKRRRNRCERRRFECGPKPTFYVCSASAGATSLTELLKNILTIDNN